MRSAIEIRERQRELLHAMLLRPSMWGVGQGYEGTVRASLLELAFIDEREAQLDAAFAGLEAEGLFRSCGVAGELERLRPDPTDAIASVYARVAAALGYFEPARRLSATEWKAIRSIATWARQAPRTREDVEARLGPPSYASAGQAPGVLAYAGPTDTRWLCFDFEKRSDGTLELIRLPKRALARAVVDLRPRPAQAER